MLLEPTKRIKALTSRRHKYRTWGVPKYSIRNICLSEFSYHSTNRWKYSWHADYYTIQVINPLKEKNLFL